MAGPPRRKWRLISATITALPTGCLAFFPASQCIGFRSQSRARLSHQIRMQPVHNHGDRCEAAEMERVVKTRLLRWCDNFVGDLGLCPWARQSLSAPGAIRIKVVPQSDGLEGFEGTLRDSAEELLRVTGYPCDTEKGEVDDNAIDLVDPNVAITFVVAAPLTGEELPEFSFALFCDFAYDLEDRLLDEADELREKKGMPHFGEEVTIAPFHPDWKFAGNDGEIDGSEADKSDSVAWEKRTPYPTISLVRTSAIAAAGCDATSRIAVHNEEVLSELGSHALGELFRERVLLGISRNLYS